MSTLLEDNLFITQYMMHHGIGSDDDLALYYQALTYLTTHKDQLAFPIYFNIPPMTKQQFSWDAIKLSSTKRCNCGNERVIRPTKPRTDFLPGAQATMFVQDKPYFRPIGGDDLSAYVQLEIINDHLVIHDEPLAPFVMTTTIMNQLITGSQRGIDLYTIEDAMSKQPDIKPILRTGYHIPLFQIETLSAIGKTFTMTLDQAIEQFTPGHTTYKLYTDHT